MSALLFAGAVQFLVLTMLDNGAMLISILVAAFFYWFKKSILWLKFFR